MKTLQYEDICINVGTKYAVNFRWHTPIYKCVVLFDTFDEATFYEDALEAGHLRVLYSSSDAVNESAKLILVYTPELLHLPIYKNEKFSHGNHIWYDIEKFIYRYPKDAVWGYLPSKGIIHCSSVQWVKYTGYNNYTHSQSPFMYAIKGSK